MNLLIENWAMGVAAIAIIFVVGLAVYLFFKKPSNEQLGKVREWLIFATLEAEKHFKDGTGDVKLRFVYDAFIIRFPWLVRVISFETFDKLVDEALVTMRKMLEDNEKIKEIVEDQGTGFFVEVESIEKEV